MAGRMRYRSVPPTGLPHGIPGPGSRIAGKYLVEGVLARGGMGIVLSAQHEVLQQRVAIKVLLPEVSRDEASAARFAREAKSIAQMQCDNVVRVMDVGTLPSGLPFMVMEHLTGFDLAEQLRRTGPLSVADAVDVVLQACVAVAEAHARGIIHRDLKPSNLFRNHTPDGASAVKVLDFGISKSMFGANGDRNVVNTVTVWGSPLYMAPEQVRSSKQIGPQTDIWSLGVILYELLTGGLPFQAAALVDVCEAIVSGAPRPLASLRPELPEALGAVVHCCLEKDPARRWPNVGAFAAALVPFAAPRAAEYAQRALRLAAVDPATGSLGSRRPEAMLMGGPRQQSDASSWATTHLLSRRRRQSSWHTVIACCAAVVLGGTGASAWTLLANSRARVGARNMSVAQLPSALSATPSGDALNAETPPSGEAPSGADAAPVEAARPSAAPLASVAPAPVATVAPSAPLAPSVHAASSGARPARHAPPATPPQGGEAPAGGGGGAMRDLSRDLSRDRK